MSQILVCIDERALNLLLNFIHKMVRHQSLQVENKLKLSNLTLHAGIRGDTTLKIILYALCFRLTWMLSRGRTYLPSVFGRHPSHGGVALHGDGYLRPRINTIRVGTLSIISHRLK